MDDEKRVYEANERFYAAMSSAEIHDMDEVWFQDPGCVCVHPGREAIVGYNLIRESWESIFAGTNSMAVSASHQRITVTENVAWVVCNETISVMTPEGLAAAAAQATNVFRRVGDTWKMTLHHASAVPLKTEDVWPDLIN
jgi:ketosteroid isomerase-like protein